jgi:mRNA-degrading endonuclease RelE of RelBE toxin-antitoxin system
MQAVQITQPARNMIESLYDHDQARIRDLLKEIEDIVADPDKASRMRGYDDVFIARSGQYRVIYRKTGDAIQVTSVQHEASDSPRHLS